MLLIQCGSLPEVAFSPQKLFVDDVAAVIVYTYIKYFCVKSA